MTKEKVVVENVFSRSNEQPSPVLLKFQNGDLKTSHKDSAIYFPVESQEDKSERAVVITSGNVYCGVVKESASALTDSYICVRNRETNKVRIIPIEQVNLINHLYQEKQKKTFETLSKDAAFARIMRNFGGRRDMRYLNSVERNKVNIDVVKDQLESTIEKSGALNETEPVISAEHNVERIRPRFNKDATNLDNVFNVYDVIPLELIDRLEEEALFLQNTEIEDIPISSQFLKDSIKSLKNCPQSSQTLLKIKIIIYMDALQTLIKTKTKSLKTLELSKITEKIENDIRERFSDGNSKYKLRTSFSNEKALCYYLVLAFLISDQYELDTSVLSMDLCMPKTKIIKFGHLVNATLKMRSNILVLRLPSSIKPMSFAFIGKRKK